MEESCQGVDILTKMIKVCITPQEKRSRVKELQSICRSLVGQLRNQKQEPTKKIMIDICGNKQEKQPSPNDNFIIRCLILILIRQRSLRLEINLRSNPRKEQNSIDLYIDATSQNLANSFRKQLKFFRQNRTLSEVDNFFKYLSIKCFDKTDYLGRRTINMAKISSDVHFFIGNFLQNFNSMFEMKMYFLKTTLHCFGDDSPFALTAAVDDKLSTYRKMVSEYRKIYTVNEYLVGNRVNFLKERLEQDYLPSEKIEMHYPQWKEDMLGYFKDFAGSRAQFLENLCISFSGTEQEFRTVSDYLRLTPNLARLKLITKQRRTYQDINYLLQSIIAHTPLLRMLCIENTTISSVPNDLLLRLYQECPFLVELEIGLTFTFAICETYQHNGPDDREIKERQREMQLILEALRLRNITLSHNYDMIKLLLKKQFNFISALQIIDCVETICI